jgi:arylsulfatase A-like enzyme
LAALHEEGLEENTLIFFFSDNGGPTIYGGVNGSSNAPLKGSKRTTWEGGIRVPFIVVRKGHVAEGKTYSQPIIQLGVLPTALAAANIKVQQQRKLGKLDGVNLLPFITGKSSKPPHQMLFWRTGGMMAIRKGRWKLLRSTELGPQEDPAVLNVLTGLELYDLKDDIGETKDLASRYPEKVKELSDAWQQWNKELAKPAWPPILVRPTGPVGP